MLILCSLCSKPASVHCINCDDSFCDEHKIDHETTFPNPSINGEYPAKFVELHKHKSKLIEGIKGNEDQKENK